MYDPATDSWSQKADMLWDGIWLGDAAISFDGKIYLMGIASSFGQTPLRNVGMYDPVTDTWTPKADIPTRRIGLATALVGGKIYAISGGSRVYEGGKTVVEVYDPGADTWSTDEVAELSIPRAAAAATAVGGKIYVVGGLNPLGQPVATVEVYDFGQPIIRSAPDVYAASGARSTPLNFEVHLDLLSDAPAPGLVLDLSDYGQSAPVDLSHQGDGRYTGQASIEVPTLSGRYNLPLQLIPADSAPEPFFDLHLVVIPSQERLLSADGLTPEWTAPNSILVTFDPQATAQVFAGQTSLSLLPRLSNNTDYLVWGPAEPIEGAGYRLHFAFYPAELVDTEEPPTFNLSIWRQSPYGVLAATIVPLLSGDGEGPGVDLQRHAWQVVEIPLGAGSIQSIRFGGNLKGTTFYLDDIRLVPEELPAPITAVLEDHQDSTPAAFNLDQNYPNPFNSGTVIRFALPQAQEVDLTIFNLAGQQAVKLVKGIRPAGQYNLTWDGRDEAGQALASGLYFYRLQAGEQVKTRKLLMLR
jgi:hypothetical protein